jgi:Trypsin-like peptidase domain
VSITDGVLYWDLFMRFLVVIFLPLLLILTATRLSAQVTANVFERVVNVRVNAGTSNEGTATAFTMDVDGREYLITAKHVVQGLKERDKIDIFVNNAWSPLDVTIFRCDDPIDIAVLAPPYQLTVNFDLPSEGATFFIGQDAYFLGFPYGIQVPSQGANGPYPLAVIKRATISAVIPIDRAKKEALVLLDGYNNPGFSGGPIVYRDLNQSTVVLKLVGVISGFEPEVVPVLTEHDIRSPAEAGDAAKAQPWKIKQRSNGTYFEYVDTDKYVALNTGIVTGYTIEPAVSLIRKHPIGPTTKDLPGNQPAH